MKNHFVKKTLFGGKGYRWFAMLLLVVLLGGEARAQVSIPGTKVKFTFPGKWKYLNTEKVYGKEPYQSLTDYTEGLGLPKTGGMGYVGAYTNVKDGKDYQFRMVYFKAQNAVVEFRLETTRATYPMMEKEFIGILKSLTF